MILLFSAGKSGNASSSCLVPFLSRLLPNDVCKIHKTGASIRVDSTLQDFTEMRWSRGDLSFIFNGENRTGRYSTACYIACTECVCVGDIPSW